MSMVAIGYQPPQRVDTVANAIDTPSQSSRTDQPSVDQLVATDIAAGMAERVNLSIAPNVASLSTSLSVANTLSQSGTSGASKPQIIQPTDGSRTIQYYTASAGETVDAVAKQFGISATTIKWANNLNTDALEPGRQLLIPPVDGVMYTAAAGDTVDTIATRYNSNRESIIAYNDLELSGVITGTKLIIPGGNLPETERPGYVAPRPAVTPNSEYGSGQRINSQIARASAGNRYAFGNCTWYAYERRAQLGLPIGSFWGNGGSWGYSAQSAGLAVDGSPAPGAIFVQAGSPGHVGIVESVNSDGTLTVTEMNNYAYGGFNIVNSRTILPGQIGQFTYIH